MTVRSAKQDKEQGCGRRALLMHPEGRAAQRLRAILEDSGFEITVRQNSTADLAGLQRHSPHLIVLADNLTTPSGEPLAAWLRREANIPILAICPPGDILAGVKMLEIGADDYVHSSQGAREIAARATRLASRALSDPAEQTCTQTP